MTDNYKCAYPCALIRVGMYHVFLRDNRARLLWIDNAVDAFKFDVLGVDSASFASDAQLAMPRFELPGGDTKHDQILAERFQEADETLASLGSNRMTSLCQKPIARPGPMPGSSSISLSDS